MIHIQKDDVFVVVVDCCESA